MIEERIILNGRERRLIKPSMKKEKKVEVESFSDLISDSRFEIQSSCELRVQPNNENLCGYMEL